MLGLSGEQREERSNTSRMAPPESTWGCVYSQCIAQMTGTREREDIHPVLSLYMVVRWRYGQGIQYTPHPGSH